MAGAWANVGFHDLTSNLSVPNDMPILGSETRARLAHAPPTQSGTTADAMELLAHAQLPHALVLKECFTSDLSEDGFECIAGWLQTEPEPVISSIFELELVRTRTGTLFGFSKTPI